MGRYELGENGDECPVSGAEWEDAVARVLRGVEQWLRQIPPCADPEDYKSEAFYAVWAARRDYHPQPGTTFAAFAWQRVQRALRDERRRQDPVSKWRRGRIRRGEAEAGPADQPPLSLEEVLADPKGRHEASMVAREADPEEILLSKFAAAQLERALRALRERERQVIELRYPQGRTQAEVAAILGVSAARISQIEHHALEKMRPFLEDSG